MSLTPQITQYILQINFNVEIIYAVHLDFSITEGSPNFSATCCVATGPFLTAAFTYHTLDNMYTINKL